MGISGLYGISIVILCEVFFLIHAFLRYFHVMGVCYCGRR